MKIILLYGPGEASKRNELLKIKKQYPPDNIFCVDLKQEDLLDLQIQLSSSSLFGAGDRLVVVENTPEKLDLKKIKIPDDLTLLLMADSPKAESVLFKSAKALGARFCNFEGEKETNIFPLLDFLIEQKKEAFIELEKNREEWGAMYILAMIYYLLRRNILPLPTSSFASGKIIRQKKKYNLQDFEKLYYLAIQTEFNIKNGVMDEKNALTHLAHSFISYNA